MAAVMTATASPVPVQNGSGIAARSPRRGDSGERGDRDRRSNGVRIASVPVVDPRLKSIPIVARSPRHGDSQNRGDSHGRRELEARRHGDSQNRGDSHGRRDVRILIVDDF
ncbi:hypothetical protein M422DRAFT_256611 [Sphaerobolus stellatus SS14]|uniref:Uncharacterized protein n=1 Tax=Sphaerobolus stellatus (strain SS14) TaxID=990650 RepID=A0A0C9UZW4_SPHS4|nr:hypothetical protein M422DRAFT_256611 [Sphaerobolus stellatus SS14]